ncbi:hypothetical protein [Devosia sp. SL43]|uniref:hypothetical protein n=1 Tax=Devosia sp. SL43 TaxID=2806348 RepID=UPI001F479343|nr:hypothetical protein [Devosia sp. SL43]UJW85206.1 hypothetical protein IM737_17665 [Devosia sp. SL43]
MKNTIVYLIGHYGVGKLTIARAICAATEARLFDNHLANNVIFSLIRADGKTPLPEGVWDRIEVIREQALLSMEELAPADASFVLTNCLLDNDPGDWAAYDRVLETARRRDSTFVPVLLAASDAAHAARMASPDRAERLKMTDAIGAERKRHANALLRIDHPNRLDLDTTTLPPSEAARLIIEHAERLA